MHGSGLPKSWFVYLVRCSDNSLYCGTTLDVARRIREHNYGDRGAKYTKSRRNVMLAYEEKLPSKSEAFSREAQIKKMPKTKKEQLVEGSKGEKDARRI